MTNRRTFIAGMAAAIASAPIAAQETPAGKRYRIGFLWDSPDVFPDALEAFRRKLRELGYVEGRNITIEYRWAEGKPARMRELADELVRLKVTSSLHQVLSTPMRPSGRPQKFQSYS